MKRAVRATRWTTLAIGLGLAVVGCNTVEGAGKDMEKAGEAIRDSAD